MLEERVLGRRVETGRWLVEQDQQRFGPRANWAIVVVVGLSALENNGEIAIGAFSESDIVWQSLGEPVVAGSPFHFARYVTKDPPQDSASPLRTFQQVSALRSRDLTRGGP